MGGINETGGREVFRKNACRMGGAIHMIDRRLTGYLKKGGVN